MHSLRFFLETFFNCGRMKNVLPSSEVKWRWRLWCTSYSSHGAEHCGPYDDSHCTCYVLSRCWFLRTLSLQASYDLNDDSVSEQLRQEGIWWQHYVSELLWYRQHVPVPSSVAGHSVIRNRFRCSLVITRYGSCRTVVTLCIFDSACYRRLFGQDYGTVFSLDGKHLELHHLFRFQQILGVIWLQIVDL